jgi:hypothetical protein
MGVEHENIKNLAERYIELYGVEAQHKAATEISRATGMKNWDDILMWHRVKSRIVRIEHLRRRRCNNAGQASGFQFIGGQALA